MTGPDPVELAAALIRCPSVTPQEGGALDLLQGVLEGLGFRCRRMPFEEPGFARVDNLYARLGDEQPNFCFAGHTDVVPVGDAAAWSDDPFAAVTRDGVLYGRGAADMKGAIAAFVAAAGRVVGEGAPAGSISLLITGDEEGPSVNGTKKMLKALAADGERLDHCLVGEPTNPDALGDMIKIGRRGSISGWITVEGVQGHAAYPHLADNPTPKLARLVDRLSSHVFDEGTAHFQATNLQATSFDVGNPAVNVIPARAVAQFNCRFNDGWTSASLIARIREILDDAAAEIGAEYSLKTHISGESFLTPPGRLSDIVAGAVESATGRKPELSTTGGTSDARFIKDYCPVVEFGLAGKTMHKVDEQAPVADIRALADIYEETLRRYFAG